MAAVIVCNAGGGNVGIERKIYRIVSYGHKDADIGKFRKRLLHSPNEQERGDKATPSAWPGRSAASL